MQLVGRRTYAVGIFIIILAVCQRFLGVQVPQEVWLSLFGLGLISLRAAVANGAGEGAAPDARRPTPESKPPTFLLLLLLPALILGGCASGSRGRISAAEWDSRSPEQLQAAQAEGAAVFGEAAGPVAQARIADPSLYAAAIDALTKLRVRVRVLSAEWGVPAAPAASRECLALPPAVSGAGGLPAAAVVCGLTRVDPRFYGGWGGACPGCDVDAGAFADACASAGIRAEALLNDRATATNIIAAASRAVASLRPGGLLVLYLSGHGGQVSDPGDASETDGKSETLCLWDGALSDNVVWSLLCQVPSGIRVWMITDTCNSGTNYRGVHDYAAGVRSRSLTPKSSILNPPCLLHWGGCGDGQSSFGSDQGGTFTTALVDAYAPGQSYAAWFAGAAARMPRGQTPTAAVVGSDFSNFPAFE